MNSAKLTVRLPPSELEFAKAYAREHGFSLTALIHRYLSGLRAAEESRVPKEVAAIAGIVPSDVDVRDDYLAHSEAKHR
jgi:hypothetical protein